MTECAEPCCYYPAVDVALDHRWYCGAHVLDDVAIEQATTGRLVPLTFGERAEAVRRLAARGLSDVRAASRLHVAPRTVERIRARHGIPPSRPSTRPATWRAPTEGIAS